MTSDHTPDGGAMDTRHQTGRCPHCGKTLPLRGNRRLVQHGLGDRWGLCPGTGQKLLGTDPEEATNA